LKNATSRSFDDPENDLLNLNRFLDSRRKNVPTTPSTQDTLQREAIMLSSPAFTHGHHAGWSWLLQFPDPSRVGTNSLDFAGRDSNTAIVHRTVGSVAQRYFRVDSIGHPALYTRDETLG
jgi:hypothetical protein